MSGNQIVINCAPFKTDMNCKSLAIWIDAPLQRGRERDTLIARALSPFPHSGCSLPSRCCSVVIRRPPRASRNRAWEKLPNLWSIQVANLLIFGEAIDWLFGPLDSLTQTWSESERGRQQYSSPTSCMVHMPSNTQVITCYSCPGGNQSEFCVGYKLLGMQKIVATFYCHCLETGSKREWRGGESSNSRM